MSKNKKKNKKKMSPQTLENIKTGFGTIISNDAVIKSARNMKGPLDLIPIGLGLVAVVLSVLPTLVSRLNVQGSSAVFASPVGLYDQGVANFVDTLVYDPANDSSREISLTIENGTYKLSTEDRNKLLNGDQWYTVSRYSMGSTEPVFEVFFNYEGSNVTDNEFLTRLNEYKNPFSGEARGDDSVKSPLASYLYFGMNTIAFRKIVPGKTTLGLNGRYDKLNGVNFTALAKQLREEKKLDPTNAKYVEEVTKFFTDVMNRSYEPDKMVQTWQYTGIFAGVNFGLIILFGAIIFIMTRGKKNPYRIFTFWETQKMAYWASFTPALLSMAIGFFMTQYAFIFFMFTFGMRMMWMSMRSLRPVAQ